MDAISRRTGRAKSRGLETVRRKIRPGFGGEFFGERFPVRVIWPGRSVVKSHPFDGAKALALRPAQVFHLAACHDPDSHSSKQTQSTLRAMDCRGEMARI